MLRFPGGHGPSPEDWRRAVQALEAIAATLQILLGKHLARGYTGGMRAPAGEQVPGREGQDLPTVVGRIEAIPAPDALPVLVDAWAVDLKARKRSINTIRQYRSTVRRALKDCGWTDAGDITPEAVTEYLAARSTHWTGSTYNRALVSLRSFTGFLRRSRELSADPLADAESARVDPSEGSRRTRRGSGTPPRSRSRAFTPGW